jgi:Uma2 family endonuclease
MMNMPGFDHGAICANIALLLGKFIREHDLGRVVCNDAGVITQRDPDSVRGTDVAFYSYQRVAKGVRRPKGYPNAVPELVFEVRSPTDRQSVILEKIAEYLNAGVSVVCAVEPEDETATIYYPDRAPVTFTSDQELTGFDFLPGFSLPLRLIFE